MAKDEKLNFAVAITFQPAHAQANNETQTAVDASKEQGRPAC